MQVKDTTSLVAHIKGVGLTDSDVTRFWATVDKNGPIPEHRPDLGPCWLWKGSKIRGYGHFSIGSRKDGTRGQARAPRVAWTLTHGPIPDNLTIDHLCRNATCVNPSHVEVVTQKVNQLRRDAVITLCINGHPLDKVLPSGKRACSACRRENTRRWRAKHNKKE